MLDTTNPRSAGQCTKYGDSFLYSREGCYTNPSIEWRVVGGVISVVITLDETSDDPIGTLFKVDAEIEPSDFSSLEHAKTILGINMDDKQALHAYISLVAKDLLGYDIANPTTTEEYRLVFKQVDSSMRDILQHIKVTAHGVGKKGLRGRPGYESTYV